MNELPPTRRSFTLTQLFVAVAIIAAFFGLVLPAIQMARESGRRTQCSNNLRQLALSVHMYHDVCNFFPPICSERVTPAANDANYSAVVNGWGWSWVVLIWPYCESGSRYGQINWKGQQRVPYSSSNAQLVNAWRTSLLFCATRRAALPVVTKGTLNLPNDSQWVGVAMPCDYAAMTSESNHGPDQAVLAEPATSQDDAPDPTNPNKRIPLRSNTTLKSLANAAAFAVMLGEKYMEQDWLGDMAYEAPAAVGHAFDPRGNVRYLSVPQSDGSTRSEGGPTGTPLDTFGSWHPRVCLFAMADASVSIRRNAGR
jgi:hypothetical protein